MFTVRQEQPADYAEVYELVAVSFATSAHADGTEPDYLNEVRTKSTFIPELSFVAQEPGGGIVGQIVLYRTAITTADGAVEALVLSPLCVHPRYFRRGIARLLVEHALARAAELGHSSVFLCGDPAIYSRLGFVPSFRYGVCHIQDPQAPWCMGRELIGGALAGVSGTIAIV